MKSDSGIIYHEPPKPLWVPRHYATPPQALSVHFKTEICDVDSRGRITHVRPGQEGWNEITDWGMDSLNTSRQDQLVNYLHLSDTLGPAKRVLTGGITLSLVITSASNIAVTASAGFFLAGDVGNTLSISDLGGAGQTQELKITAYTDSQHVTCSTRPGAWLPGFVAGTGPFSSAGVHFTSVNTLANQTQKFNTYDTSVANYSAELNDSGNQRFIHQRIFLSDAAGTNWTINQLGWSDGNVGNNVFGKVNLSSPDLVGTGKKYRVTLQLYSAYAPINIASQSVNWGATIGTYDLKIVQERIGYDSVTNPPANAAINFLQVFRRLNAYMPGWTTSAQTPQALKWEGDAGYNSYIHPADGGYSNNTTDVIDGAYTNGQHTKTRLVKWSDSLAIAAATMLGVSGSTISPLNSLGVYPNVGTISKPAGYWCALTFSLYWTRAFTN